MKHFNSKLLLTLLLLMCATITFAHDFAVSNSNGKTIYYGKNSDGISVYVTYRGRYRDSYSNEYSGEIVIPETVTYGGKTYSVTSIGAAFDGCSGLTSVTIPASVTSIGSGAFNGCSGLTEIKVDNGNSVYDSRNDCNAVIETASNTIIAGCKKTIIPNSVTSIGSSAFSGCSGLTSVTIPNSVTSIGYEAFYNTRIKSLTIGSGIQTIDSRAFDYSSSGGGAKPVKVIWLSNTPPSGYKNAGGTINYVPNNSYSGLSGQKIYPFLSSMFEVDGIKYVPVSPSERTCDAIDCVYNESAENTKISNTVTYKNINMTVQSVGDFICTGNFYIKNLEYLFDSPIGSSAFSGCSGLTSVTIGSSVTSIGSDAFNNCSSLKKVIVPNFDIKKWCSIKFGNHYANPLYYARHLYSDENTEITELIIPDDMTSIPNYVFSGCSGLTSVTIPNSVTSIGSSAFSDCSGLTSVTIPNSVTSIGEDAFSGCSGLKSITWNAKNYPAISSVFSHPFYDISTQITEFIIGDDMTSIPDYMCYGMSNLKSVTIPNSVTSIGALAFYECSGLTSVTIPNNVTSIGSYAFSGCSGLTSVTIPDSVTSIGSSAFSHCSGLTSVTIPNSVTSIGDFAFFGCSGLTSLTIPNCVTSIGISAFSGCSGLTSVTIPNSVTSIGSSAFSGCSGLTSVTIPNSVTSIGSDAFNGCSGLQKVIVPNIDIKNWCNIKFTSSTDNPLSFAHHLYSDENTEITKLVIPNDVTSINSYAFYGCSGLTSVTFPNSVTSIGQSAFSDCSGLKKVIVPDIKNWCSIKFGDYSANPLSYAHHLYSDENTEITELVIPNSVTSIGNYAFYGCRGLTSVTIGNSVTSIGSSAFYNCSGLTSVTIPNSVTNIGSTAFSGCSGLNSVTIGNSVTSIGSTIFSGCSSLTSVRFENSKDNTPIVLENNNVFSDCPLDEVYIGRKLSYTTTSSAGYSPFYKKTTLRSVKFTDKETEISDYEFYGCTNLTDVSMGDGVKSIGAYAFSGCSSLEHFTCGRQLESIGKEAFSDCTSMTKFRTRAAVPPTCGAQALDDINKWECTLYVPTESIDDYQAADQWKNFFFIEKFNLQGDSNGDDVVNAKDYSGVASYIMDDTPAEFDAEASDVDENGDIDVRDYVGIANIISTGSIYGGTSNNAKAAMSKGAAMPMTDESDAENVIYVENVSGSKNSQIELSVRMRNASDIRGFQFDLYLPEGVTIANNAKASLSSDRLAAGDAHTLMVNEVTDGAVRFLCSSMNDESFAVGDGEIATLTVNIADNMTNGDYDVVVKNALMTETDISRSYEADDIKSTLTVLDQTGVETVTADNERRDGTIYTVGGQLVGKKATTSQLRKGIYIRNGKKIVVK